MLVLASCGRAGAGGQACRRASFWGPCGGPNFESRSVSPNCRWTYFVTLFLGRIPAPLLGPALGQGAVKAQTQVHRGFAHQVLVAVRGDRAWVHVRKHGWAGCCWAHCGAGGGTGDCGPLILCRWRWMQGPWCVQGRGCGLRAGPGGARDQTFICPPPTLHRPNRDRNQYTSIYTCREAPTWHRVAFSPSRERAPALRRSGRGQRGPHDGHAPRPEGPRGTSSDARAPPFSNIRAPSESTPSARAGSSPPAGPLADAARSRPRDGASGCSTGRSPPRAQRGPAAATSGTYSGCSRRRAPGQWWDGLSGRP